MSGIQVIDANQLVDEFQRARDQGFPQKKTPKHPAMVSVDGMFEGTFVQFENCFMLFFRDEDDADTKLELVQEWCEQGSFGEPTLITSIVPV